MERWDGWRRKGIECSYGKKGRREKEGGLEWNNGKEGGRK